jgi:hypothetical protein
MKMPLSTTDSFRKGDIVQLASLGGSQGPWRTVIRVIDRFYLYTVDTVTGKRSRVCVWDIKPQ